MKKIKIISQVFIIILVLVGCQSVKEGMTGKKMNEGEEFLVKKKNPLVVPPDFEDLPIPSNSNNTSAIDENNENDFKKLLEGKTKKKTEIRNDSKTTTEQSILKKVKNN